MNERGKLILKKPGKHTATVAGMSSGATGLEMGLVIGLYGVAFGALVAHPLLVVAVFPPEMFLDSDKIAERVARVVVETTRLRADKHSLLHLILYFPLQQLPRNLVSSSVHLQILVSLEALVADLAYITV